MCCPIRPNPVAYDEQIQTTIDRSTISHQVDNASEVLVSEPGFLHVSCLWVEDRATFPIENPDKNGNTRVFVLFAIVG